MQAKNSAGIYFLIQYKKLIKDNYEELQLVDSEYRLG